VNLLDVAFLLVLIVSVVGGLVRGLIREVLGLVGLVLGFVLAVLLAPAVAPHLEKWMVHAAAYAVAFLGLFFFMVIVAGILGNLLTRFMETIHLSCLNRLAGGLFGLVRGALLIIVLFWGLLFFVDHPERMMNRSRLAPLVYRGAQWFGGILPGGESSDRNEMI
jgi:membrane protein required for colicin V production